MTHEAIDKDAAVSVEVLMDNEAARPNVHGTGSLIRTGG